jgi:antitoxin component of MazEF toxin-antitoxin module
MKKKLVKHGNSLALVIEKPILEIMEVDGQTDLDMSLDGKTLIVRHAKKGVTKTRKEELRDLAREITDYYDPVFRKLSKT